MLKNMLCLLRMIITYQFVAVSLFALLMTKRTLRVRLSDLPLRQSASVNHIEPVGTPDAIAERLNILGFVPGEAVRMIAKGPFGDDPLLVQVGFTRFALRLSEAARIHIDMQEKP